MLYFSNANIAPREEYERRLEAVRSLAQSVNAELIVDDGVSHEEWLESVGKGYEALTEGGERCRRCFAFNLKRAADYARARGYELFTTSLTVSPHKRSSLIFEVGKAVGGDAFLEENFKKRDGFKRSLELTSRYGLYRQSYCGCEFSLRDATEV